MKVNKKGRPKGIKKDVKEEFEKLIDSIKSDYIVMSYSTEGILDSNFIMEVLKRKGKTKMYNTFYRRFKTNAWTEKNTNLKEILFICKVLQDKYIKEPNCVKPIWFFYKNIKFIII